MNIMHQSISTRFMRWYDTMQSILARINSSTPIEKIYEDCMECRRLLFENGKAFVVVNVEEHPCEIRLHILLAGGTMEGLDELDPVVSKFGHSIGASKMTLLGRKGLLRCMAKRGWKAPLVYMEKEL